MEKFVNLKIRYYILKVNNTIFTFNYQWKPTRIADIMDEDLQTHITMNISPKLDFKHF